MPESAFHRFDAVFGGGFGVVLFVFDEGFVSVIFQAEIELATIGGIEFENCHLPLLTIRNLNQQGFFMQNTATAVSNIKTSRALVNARCVI